MTNLELSWSAPSNCPNAAQVRSQIDALLGKRAANAQFSSVKLHERNWNDFPTSNLVTTNNYPSLIEFTDSATQATGFLSISKMK